MGIGELAMKNVTAFGSEIDFLEGYIFHDAIFLTDPMSIATKNAPENSTC